jgi:hydroxylaminobenzene mutase
MGEPGDAHARWLLVAGAALLLTGLLSGLMVGAMANPRLGLSAHLEAVMNGTLLIAIGLAWHRLALCAGWKRAAFWLLLYGTIANWLTVQLGAWWGAGRLTTLAAGGMTGADWQEAIVAFGLVSLSAAMIAAVAILVVGFWRAR